jgi:hypothetical protein
VALRDDGRTRADDPRRLTGSSVGLRSSSGGGSRPASRPRGSAPSRSGGGENSPLGEPQLVAPLGDRETVGVTTRYGRRTEPRWVEDLLSGTQVAGAGRLRYVMEGESARAVEEEQPSQPRTAPKAERLAVGSAA